MTHYYFLVIMSDVIEKVKSLYNFSYIFFGQKCRAP